MILLDDDERYELRMLLDAQCTTHEYETTFTKAQAKKIALELQSIYKLPDLKMEHERMGEFIEKLMEEINGN